MKKYLASLSGLFSATLFFAASASDIPKNDLAGTHDHPIISRFAGSTIIGYQTIDFDEAAFPLAPFKNGAFVKSDSAKGRITRIAYSAPPGKSVLEISTNFEKALDDAGFEKRFACRGTPENPSCGDAFNLSMTLVPERLLPSLTQHSGSGGSIIDALWATSDSIFIETARLDRPDGPVDVTVLINRSEGKAAGIYLQICEAKAMSTGQVTVDAKAMAQSLSQQGHIALYGIHFGTDSAVINADSNPTLGEMASLMKSQPALKVYIVGHTDDSGTLDHNLVLSAQRAQAVVKALQDLGVSADKMTAKGMASFGPVATNTTDEGKARNRRVELVEQ
jgi:outer membrane protein OmpA-like peptidoglycan-associated protein